MLLTIKIINSKGAVKAHAVSDDRVTLVYPSFYEEGDSIWLESDRAGYIVAQLEDSIESVFGFLKAPFMLPVPFGEKRVSYSPKCFTEGMHLLRARIADEDEIRSYRNLALNPLDNHHNCGLFPHACANVETRGESVFAARNAINGNTASAGHGPWPYESWGISQQDDAELHIDFGRRVTVDKAVITLRADFPHDNWWKQAKISFSDGSAITPLFEKSGIPQAFVFRERTVQWAKFGGLIKDETDPSPFPALIQIEFWGKNAAGAVPS